MTRLDNCISSFADQPSDSSVLSVKIEMTSRFNEGGPKDGRTQEVPRDEESEAGELRETTSSHGGSETAQAWPSSHSKLMHQGCGKCLETRVPRLVSPS